MNQSASSRFPTDNGEYGPVSPSAVEGGSFARPQQMRDPLRRPSGIPPSVSTPQGLSERSPAVGYGRPFQPSHSHSQSTSVLMNTRPSPQQHHSQQQIPGSQRSVSMRPMSAFQPLDNPDYYVGGGTFASPTSPRPPSPTGSVARSIRSSQTPLTFKSQDLRSALSLQEAQQRKLYMEGYLLKRDDLGTDGKPLHAGDDKRRWTECFVQLSGTVLSLWNVDQMEEAARQGTEVPPTYINITDSFVDFIGLLIEDPKLIPGSRGRYHHAFAINSAGNNRTIFCFRDPPPFPPDAIEQWLAPEHRQKPEHRTVIGWLNLGHRHLQAWINAIRLASWEKVRLEEIYTGALIRARLGAVGGPGTGSDATKDTAATPSASDVTIKSPLTKGKMEGWVKARFMGTTEWKKVWLVLTDHKPDGSELTGKKKFWKLGGSGDRSSVMSISSVSNNAPGAAGADGNAELPPPPGGNGAPGVANFFESKKAKKPFASLIYAAHAFAVYPSRPELVEGSSLFKIEGVFPSSTVLSATHRARSTGWVMLMPELEGSGSKGANAEMMKWIIAFMDSFKLYGRPDAFVWDARNPLSPFFAYPIGPFKERLFLDRELAEFLEIAREDHLTTRASLHGIMSARMRGERTKILQPLPPPSQNLSLPGVNAANTNNAAKGAGREAVQEDYAPEIPPLDEKLPPLDFESKQNAQDHKDSAAASAGRPDSFANESGAGRADESGRTPAELTGFGATARPVASQADASRTAREVRPGQPTQQDSFNASGYTVDNPAPAPALQSVPMSSKPSSGAPAPGSFSGDPLAHANVANHTTSSMAPTHSQDSASASAMAPSSRVLPTIPNLHTVQSARPTEVVPDASRAQNLQGLRASEADVLMKSSRPASATHSAPAHPTATESSLAYLKQSTDATSTSSHPAVPNARNAPAFGPSGRGAEVEPIDQNRSRADADLPSSYDESALFYMASISDQLPPTDSRSNAVLAATQGSQGSQSQGLGAGSGVNSAVPSESTHATRISTDPAPQTMTEHTSKTAGSAVPPRPSQAQDDSINDDALAAYSFLEQPPSPVAHIKDIPAGKAEPIRPHRAVRVPANNVPAAAPADDQASIGSSNPPSVMVRPSAAQYPSTFGQNKRAVERKTAAQLQAQAHQEALSRPGRSGANQQKVNRRPGWADDSEEEEEDEEDEDDEDDERGAEAGDKAIPGRTFATSSVGGGSGTNSPARMNDSIGSLGGRSNDPRVQQQAGYAPTHPGLPMSQSAYGQSLIAGSDVNRPRSNSPGQSPARPGQAHPGMQNPNRQSFFNSHLATGHGDDSRSNTPPRDRQTFLQLNPEEQPGAMTTVFTPHGLVQAGAQEKAERSAKAQEAEARAQGGHLVNVPNKPPPPQAGLLGAITAHERDRKGAGGFGATLTERERDRVVAERRQREEDLLRQQQQQQQQQQMQQMAYFNPMMYQQMMMSGMMPGMGMGMMGMGMPGMGGYAGSQVGGAGGGGSQMGGFDPMMAQQQAMQAAQLAYMNALSQAHQEGSALGHGSVMGHGSPSVAPASPMGMPMGSMPFMGNPHMSMMGGFPGFMGGSGMGSPSEMAANMSPRPTSARPNQPNGQQPNGNAGRD